MRNKQITKKLYIEIKLITFLLENKVTHNRECNVHMVLPEPDFSDKNFLLVIQTLGRVRTRCVDFKENVQVIISVFLNSALLPIVSKISNFD